MVIGIGAPISDLLGHASKVSPFVDVSGDANDTLRHGRNSESGRLYFIDNGPELSLGGDSWISFKIRIRYTMLESVLPT